LSKKRSEWGRFFCHNHLCRHPFIGTFLEHAAYLSVSIPAGFVKTNEWLAIFAFIGDNHLKDSQISFGIAGRYPLISGIFL
jgi:hypothetical protein